MKKYCRRSSDRKGRTTLVPLHYLNGIDEHRKKGKFNFKQKIFGVRILDGCLWQLMKESLRDQIYI